MFAGDIQRQRIISLRLRRRANSLGINYYLAETFLYPVDKITHEPARQKMDTTLDHEMNALPALKEIRDADRSDIAEIVRVHQIAFKGFFLDRMGPAFLRAYYRAILDYDAAILLVHCEEAGKVDGFVAGFLEPDRFYAYLRTRRVRMLPTITLALLRRPNLLLEIVRNSGRVARAAELHVAAAELASIGVSRRGTGAGSRLLRTFCDRGAALGAGEVRLTTDRDDNGAVVRFYLDHGFEHRGVEFRGERALYNLARKAGA